MNTRREAVSALGKIDDLRAIDPLTYIAQNEGGFIQTDASEAIDKIKELNQ